MHAKCPNALIRLIGLRYHHSIISVKMKIPERVRLRILVDIWVLSQQALQAQTTLVNVLSTGFLISHGLLSRLPPN